MLTEQEILKKLRWYSQGAKLVTLASDLHVEKDALLIKLSRMLNKSVSKSSDNRWKVIDEVPVEKKLAPTSVSASSMSTSSVSLQSKTPSKPKPIEHVYRPVGNDSRSLFEFCVKKAMELGVLESKLTHIQWAGKLFSYTKTGYERIDLMSKVKRDYSIYFVSESNYSVYGFDVEKIRERMPKLFGEKPDNESDDPLVELFIEIQDALSSELKEQSSLHNIETFKVAQLNEIKRHQGVYIYIATLQIQEGADPHFSEGKPFFYRYDGRRYMCETIDFDAVEAQLYFTCPTKLYRAYDSVVMMDMSYLVKGLKDRLNEIAGEELDDDLPLMKFIYYETEDVLEIEHAKVDEMLYKRLDESQQEAFHAALDNDITFIWGPPGTGKSFTLASIINALYKLGEDRTAVCCLSNVAVDQLVNKVVDLIEESGEHVAPGNLYRAGHTLDERVLGTDFLFPNDNITKELRKSIQEKKRVLERLRERKMEFSETGLETKTDIKNLRDKLKKHTDYLVGSSKVVFSTITNFVMSSSIKNAKYDNLIIDEASMLALPSLVALASKITKRIILVGDFQQLSPIASVPDEILNENVFNMAGIDIEHTKHPALYQLLNQRRSNKRIVDMINGTFYKGRLICDNVEKHPLCHCKPFPGCVVGFKNVEGAELRFTKGGTRQNLMFAANDVKLALDVVRNTDEKHDIGIITPYKGQVALIYALLAGIRDNNRISEEELKRIKVGTVHTFQGSECDVIIYDMVDCSTMTDGKKGRIGKIYGGSEGERLLNVAISRARHKLIIVGEIAFLEKIPGNVTTSRTNRILEAFSKLKFTKE